MTYTIDSTIESPVKVDERNRLSGIDGKRRIKNVRIKGEALDPEKVYKVAAANHVLLDGGNGHVFSDAKIIEANYMTDAEALSHYIRDFQRLPERYRNKQGRIRFIMK